MTASLTEFRTNEVVYRLLVTGGGTGGHIFPAVSIAQGFLRRHGDRAQVLYVGSERGQERDLVPQLPLPFETLRVEGFVGGTWRQRMRSAHLLLGALAQSYRLLRAYKPHIVVGTGGYVSVPVVRCAQWLKIPTVIQEQNVFPGQANRWLSRRADRVLVPDEAATRHFPIGVQPRIRVTGNPVRPEIVGVERETARQYFGLNPQDVLVLIVGGSGGALTINRAAVDFIQRRHIAPSGRLHLLFVTGPRYYEAMRQECEAYLGPKLRVIPYLPEMPLALGAADLLVGRAGAMTLAEATMVGLPMLLVPSPNVSHDHQSHNARALVQAGAARMIADSEFSGCRLGHELCDLLSDSDQLARMRVASQHVAKPYALSDCLDVLDELLEGSYPG